MESIMNTAHDTNTTAAATQAARTTDQTDDAECSQREDCELEPDELRPGSEVHYRPVEACSSSGSVSL